MSTFVSTADPTVGRSRITRIFAMLVGIAVLCFGAVVGVGPAAQAEVTASGELTGTVANSVNIPWEKLRIHLDNKNEAGSPDYVIDEFGTDGAFSLAGIEAGDYVASAVELKAIGNLNDFASLQFLMTGPDSATLSIASGEVKTQNFALQAPTARFSGTIRANGATRASMFVYQSIGGEQLLLGQGWSGSGGVAVPYQSALLVPGTYFAQFGAHGASSSWWTYWTDDAPAPESRFALIGNESRQGMDVNIRKKFDSTPNPSDISFSVTPRVGVPVTASLGGTWVPAADTFEYRWFPADYYEEGHPVVLNKTYTPSPTDVGMGLNISIAGSNDDYGPYSLGTFVNVLPGLFNAPKPSVSGETKVGSTLTANTSGWSPAADTYTYQWLRDGNVIAGKQAKNYTLSGSDQGKQISVKVNGTKAGYENKTVTSNAVVVEAADLLQFRSTPTPAISGTVKVGKTLTANAGPWKPTADRLTYQWLRNGEAVDGATTSKLVLAATDAGAQFTVKVTGAKTGYTTVSKISAKTAKVATAAYEAPAETPFNDVKTNYKFYEPIAWMFTEGLSTGVKTSNGRDYQPKVGVSREAMAAFLYRLEGANYQGPAKSPFADIKKGDKFYNEIAWMYKTGLSTGVKQADGKTNYAPKAKVSREAMAAFIYRLEEATTKAPKTSPFGDMNYGGKFYKEISWMGTEGLSTGIKQSSGKPFYAPKASVSREAMAAFLFRLETR